MKSRIFINIFMKIAGKARNIGSRIREHSRGQLLIESGISISILVVGLLGIFSLLSRSLSLNNVITSQYIASNLASEGIEVVKNLIDNNVLQKKPWNLSIPTGSYEAAFDSLALDQNENRFLQFNPSTGIYSYGIGQPTPYKRDIEITDVGPDEIKVNSTVSWQIRGGSYSVNLEDHFFNWRNTPANNNNSSNNIPVDLIQLADTTHFYSGGNTGSGPESIDGDYGTYYGLAVGSTGGSAVESTHTFAKPHTVTQINFKFYTHTREYGDDTGFLTIDRYVQWYNGSTWATVPGSDYNHSESHYHNGYDAFDDVSSVSLTGLDLENCSAIKAYDYVVAYNKKNSNANAQAYIYEIQSFGVNN